MLSQIQAEGGVVFYWGNQTGMWGGLAAQDLQGEEHPLQIWDATVAQRKKAPLWSLILFRASWFGGQMWEINTKNRGTETGGHE